MKRFTLIQALQAIEKVFMTDIESIERRYTSGHKFNFETDGNNYYITLSDTGIVNSIIKLES